MPDNKNTPAVNNKNVAVGIKKKEKLIGIDSKRPVTRGRSAMVTEKPKNFKESWGKMIRYMHPEMPAVVIAMLCVISA